MTTPAYKHPELKSLSEAQSEKEDPQCDCGTYLDEDDWQIGSCKDCQDQAKRKDRKDYESEYGIVEWEDMRAGRGMPKG